MQFVLAHLLRKTFIQQILTEFQYFSSLILLVDEIVIISTDEIVILYQFLVLLLIEQFFKILFWCILDLTKMKYFLCYFMQ